MERANPEVPSTAAKLRANLRPLTTHRHCWTCGAAIYGESLEVEDSDSRRKLHVCDAVCLDAFLRLEAAHVY